MDQDNLDFNKIQEEREILTIKENMAIQKALTSNDPNEFYKAQNFLKKQEQRKQALEGDGKAIMVDPNDVNASLGYKSKPFDISYQVLRAMARTPIIKAIVKTRKDQVLSFCQPQTNKYSTGFIIKKRESLVSQKKVKKLTKADENKIEYLTNFILSCGHQEHLWHADTFDVFLRKIAEDSLTLDQSCFEIVRNKKGEVSEFYATDGGTMRIADSFEDEESYFHQDSKIINGYKPSTVQVIDSRPVAEFYPWEMCFGVRNPSSDILLNGYGKSELEDMIQTVTALLNADFYNANFFKVGSAPKGILKYSGNMNGTAVEDFRRQWQSQTSGVLNMHKLPMINADKMDFISLQQSNKDMEFNKYQEFLIKIACAIYAIDPAEIGFPMSGTSDVKPMFEGDNEAKLKFSKDKGLKPLLKSIQHWINKYIIWQIDSQFEFIFVGIQDEVTFEQDLDYDIKMVNSFMTINEIREKRNLPPIEGGDIISNPTFIQAQQMQQMGGGQPEGGDQGGDQNDDQDSANEEEGSNDNPFMKSLNEDIRKLFFND